MRARTVYRLLVAVVTFGAAWAGGAMASYADVPVALAAAEGAARVRIAEEAGPDGPATGVRRAGGGDESRARTMAMMRRGQVLQLLEDPDVMGELGVTPQQEKKIAELREKAMSLLTHIREQTQAKIEQQITPDMSDEEKMAIRREAMQAMAQAMQEARADFEIMISEAENVLAPDQRERLAAIGRERSEADTLTGGLSLLLTARAREECGLSRDQVEQIRVMLKRLEADAKALREKTLKQAAKGPPPDDPQGESARGENAKGENAKGEDADDEDPRGFQAQHRLMVKKTRGRIMTILTGEQGEKVEKFLASRGRRPGDRRQPATGDRRPSDRSEAEPGPRARRTPERLEPAEAAPVDKEPLREE